MQGFRLNSLLSLTIGLLVLFIAISWIFDLPSRNAFVSLGVSPDEYRLTGSFEEMAARIGAESQNASNDERRWLSEDRETETTGRLLSPEFLAPKSLSLDVAGAPSQSNLAIMIEQRSTGEKLRLIANDTFQGWQRYIWPMPDNWVDKPIQIEAIDAVEQTDMWIGLSQPMSPTWVNTLQFGIGAITFLLKYNFHFVLFILPGLLVYQQWFESKLNQSQLAALFIIGVISLLGYLTFWIYWINNILGMVSSCLVVLITVLTAGFGIAKGNLLKILKAPDITYPLLLFYLTGLFYLSILYLYSHPSMLSDVVVNSRFFRGMPVDNVLQKALADRLYFGDDPRPLWGEWQSSDRPPLQTGIVLLQSPLVGLLFPNGWGLSYQIVATISQCSWVVGAWALCRQLKLKGSSIAIALGFCIFSGFFLLNSVFVWPKLLAATLCCGLIIVTFQSLENARPSYQMTALAALGAGLGLMSHSGVVFTLIPILLILSALKKTFGLKKLAIVVCMMIVVVAPWAGYQKLYEPPGNRLVKWHLAGVVEIDERSSGEAIVEEYKVLGLQSALSYKADNFKRLISFEDGLQGLYRRYQEKPLYQKHREHEFFILLVGLGLLNIGWLLMILSYCRQWLGNKHLSKSQELFWFLPVLGLLGIAVWCLLLFGPATTTIHAGSYATMLVLFVGLSAWLTRVPRWLCLGALGGQIALFLSTWILLPPHYPENALLPSIRELVDIEALYPAMNWSFSVLIFVFGSLIAAVLLKLSQANSFDMTA